MPTKPIKFKEISHHLIDAEEIIIDGLSFSIHIDKTMLHVSILIGENFYYNSFHPDELQMSFEYIKKFSCSAILSKKYKLIPINYNQIRILMKNKWTITLNRVYYQHWYDLYGNYLHNYLLYSLFELVNLFFVLPFFIY